MSKRQERRHLTSLAEAQWYDNLSADKKKAYTRAKVISCKRVHKEGTYNIPHVEMILMRRGIWVENRTINIPNSRPKGGIGIKLRGKIDYLVNVHGYYLIR